MIDTKRDNRVDIVKALAIIAVVTSHTDSPINKFVCLFHVGVFFIASGLFFKNEYTDSCKSLLTFIIKKLKGLYIPFAVWNIIFLVLQNFFLKIGIYTSDIDVLKRIGQTSEDLVLRLGIGEFIKGVCRALLFAGGPQLGGPMWFLRILFQIVIVYALINFFLYKVCKKRSTVLVLQGIVALVFFIVGDYFSVNGITTLGIGKTLSYYSLFYMGYLFRIYCIEKEITNKSIVNAVILVVSLSTLWVLSCNGTLSYSAHRYPNLIFFLTAVISGWFFLWSMAYFIKQCSIAKVFCYLGKKSLIVMILHVLCFKIVSAVYIICTNREAFFIAAFPSIRGIGVWWIIYVLVGITVSLLADLLFEKTKNILFREK